VTWRQLYKEASNRLGAGAEARWLVEEASGGDWPSVLDEEVPARSGKFFASLLDRRSGGEPLQYVLGHWAFRRLDLMVDRRALIPRPETEVVVDVALRELERLEVPEPVVVDLGTGSGAIALSVAAECKGARVWATDKSERALEVASANVTGLGALAAGRVRLLKGSWWEALPTSLMGTVDLVVTNPPYIAEHETEDLPPAVKDWEPPEALVAGRSGLEAYEALLPAAGAWMAPRSAFVSELAPHQAEAVAGLAKDAGFDDVSVLLDLARRRRVLVARR